MMGDLIRPTKLNMDTKFVENYTKFVENFIFLLDIGERNDAQNFKLSFIF